VSDVWPHNENCRRAWWYGKMIGCPICNLRIFLKILLEIMRVGREAESERRVQKK